MTNSKQNSGSQTNLRKSTAHSEEVDLYINRFLDTVCDKSRRSILELLIPLEGSSTEMMEIRSGDIAREIGLSAATTSEHLRILTEAGLITPRRQGNVVYYRLRNHKLVQAFRALIDGLVQDYADRHCES